MGVYLLAASCTPLAPLVSESKLLQVWGRGPSWLCVQMYFFDACTTARYRSPTPASCVQRMDDDNRVAFYVASIFLHLVVSLALPVVLIQVQC